MSKTLNKAEDLFTIIPPESLVSNDKFLQMVIYSRTVDLTLNVMYVVCKARGNPSNINIGNSDCIQHYHSITVEKDKVQQAKEYGEGKFSILSCSPALELGQNQNQVKLIVIMGAMDPSISYQLSGKAGCDGHSGLIVYFVRCKMPKSPNNASEIVTTLMTNQDQMHVFRLTSCCLRVAYAVNTLKNKKGN
ncbi:uncharacterized protein MELLADRAFT_108099 [Melampsora larici-populina 98AG31]|uniref:Uncharacterized protein n=1 Tax=Melampsora larici-populina (strain 98AG31 / pathotype 3-4-7) TaxID=747676 RepID=F4RRZ2_MELLP|nr:uncharacterized protein MELLADRAFT_108099 [Melampsora larici-populina 98AG31]EGG04868.1 hypothetical protein MELLADRAFT_108099 [Melampsora larici-populina 98AG31]